MKHTLRDICIWAVATLGIAFLYRAYIQKRGPLVRVIVLHDVDDAVWFSSLLDMCTRSYHMLTPEAFTRRDFDHEKINVLLTFDDGYDSWVRVCVPILKKYGVLGIFFITTGILEAARDREATALFMTERLRIRPKKPLTPEGVQMLLNEGHTIGGHTHTHPNLGTLALEAAKQEISINKEKLEGYRGQPIVDFAYPFGKTEHRSDQVLELLTEVGYTSVYTANAGFVDTHREQKEIPRMCIEKNQSMASIQRWIRGAYDIFQSIHGYKIR